MDYSRPPSYHRLCSNGYMVAYSSLSGQDNAVVQSATSGQTHLARNQATFADYTIMGDLHKVIYLRAGTYYSVTEFRPVNTAVGADLNAIFNYNAAVMRNPSVLAVDKFISVPRRSDCGVSQNDAIVAYLAVVIDHDIAVQASV